MNAKIQLKCPHCSKMVQLAAQIGGRCLIRCPRCDQPIAVPESKPVVAEPVAFTATATSTPASRVVKWSRRSVVMATVGLCVVSAVGWIAMQAYGKWTQQTNADGKWTPQTKEEKYQVACEDYFQQLKMSRDKFMPILQGVTEEWRKKRDEILNERKKEDYHRTTFHLQFPEHTSTEQKRLDDEIRRVKRQAEDLALAKELMAVTEQPVKEAERAIRSAKESLDAVQKDLGLPDEVCLRIREAAQRKPEEDEQALRRQLESYRMRN